MENNLMQELHLWHTWGESSQFIYTILYFRWPEGFQFVNFRCMCIPHFIKISLLVQGCFLFRDTLFTDICIFNCGKHTIPYTSFRNPKLCWRQRGNLPVLGQHVHILTNCISWTKLGAVVILSQVHIGNHFACSSHTSSLGSQSHNTPPQKKHFTLSPWPKM